jgi:hypothetical protein
MEHTYYIYKITCKDETIKDFYVGSTNNITVRKYQHKTCCNNEKSKKYNLRVYKTIRENGGWINWDFTVIEQLKEHTKIQAHIREEHHRKELNASLNSQKAHITKEELKEYKKEYMKEYKKEYYEINKDKLIDQQKEYYEINKDIIKEYKKEWYEFNKDKINEKITCECGGKYTHHHKSTHFKSKKHTDFQPVNECVISTANISNGTL